MSVLNGPGEGTWSVFAGKVVQERDEARRERDEARRERDDALRERDDALRERAALPERDSKVDTCPCSAVTGWTGAGARYHAVGCRRTGG